MSSFQEETFANRLKFHWFHNKLARHTGAFASMRFATVAAAAAAI